VVGDMFHILAQHRGTITCAAKIFSNLGTFQCACGHNFWRKGDLTRNQIFVELQTCHWFRRDTLLSLYTIQRAATKYQVCV